VRVQELFDLSGRVAIVTGGGRGIGRHLALGLAEAGADVAVASRKIAACEATARALEKLGRRALAVAADVAVPAQSDALVDRVLAELGRVDVLVNNAGITWAAPTLEYPLEAWDRVFAVNVRGAWHLSQRVARHMAERGSGSIVHVSSISAWKGAPEEEQPVVAYMASKGALLALTRDLAVKLAPHGIRVNCIAPGPFATDMMQHMRNDLQRYQAYLRTIPLRRCGEEDDIKGAVVFLASEASRFVTGHTLVVDGGVMAS
jgi:NAD(P)-dependent dehydrogenase (short-subunit alcohol dehydrogenase family)